jgi:hypothetical protein
MLGFDLMVTKGLPDTVGVDFQSIGAIRTVRLSRLKVYDGTDWEGAFEMTISPRDSIKDQFSVEAAKAVRDAISLYLGVIEDGKEALNVSDD